MVRGWTSGLLMVTLLNSLTGQQLDKGTLTAGGTFAFSFAQAKSNGEAETLLTLQFTPSVGGFVSRRIWLGGMLGYQLRQTIVKTTDQFGNINESKNTVHSLQAGPAVRPYFKIGNSAYFTFQVSPMFSYGETRFGSNTRYIVKGIAWGAGPGLAVFLHPNIAIEPVVEYRGGYFSEYIRDQNGPLPATKNNFLQHAVFFGLGLQAYFHKTKQ